MLDDTLILSECLQRALCRKYEEIYPPEVKEFAYITDDTYTLQQVQQFFLFSRDTNISFSLILQ